MHEPASLYDGRKSAVHDLGQIWDGGKVLGQTCSSMQASRNQYLRVTIQRLHLPSQPVCNNAWVQQRPIMLQAIYVPLMGKTKEHGTPNSATNSAR